MRSSDIQISVTTIGGGLHNFTADKLRPPGGQALDSVHRAAQELNRRLTASEAIEYLSEGEFADPASVTLIPTSSITEVSVVGPHRVGPQAF